MGRSIRIALALLMMAGLAACAQGQEPTGEGATVSPTVTVEATVEVEGTTASGADASVTSEPGTEPTTVSVAAEALPIILKVPEGWLSSETADGILVVEREDCLKGAELECAALMVRLVPEATSASQILATYDLSGATRQRGVPLVIARNPVDAVDATLVSALSGRVYQVVLAPLMLRGDALLFIASMPQGQAESAWPILATMLGSVEALED